MNGETVAGAIAEWHTAQYSVPPSTMRILGKGEYIGFYNTYSRLTNETQLSLF